MKSRISPKEGIDFGAIVERLLKSMGSRLDSSTGSIARTLAEAYAREMATFYAMLELAHASGYIDTAEGGALDNVVALLDVKRARAGRLIGHVEFSRSTPAPSDIGIPAGSQVTGSPSSGPELLVVETTQDAVLPRGQRRVVVAVQEVDYNPAEAKGLPVVNPGTLTVMPRGVYGIEEVANTAPLRRNSEDETDASLRARARTALRQGEMGTLDAIAGAVRQAGVEHVTVSERADGPPGVLDVVVSDVGFNEQPQEVKDRVWEAIRTSKAAGIRAHLKYAETIYLQPQLAVEPTDPNLDEAGFDRLRLQLMDKLVAFVDDLPVGERMSRRKLEAILYGTPGVRQISDIRIDAFTRDASKRFVDVNVALGENQDWVFKDLDKAAVDRNEKRPIITRLRPPTYLFSLNVLTKKGDRRPPEELRKVVRAALDAYAEELTVERKTSVDKEALTRKMKGLAGIAGLVSVDITDETGLVRDFKIRQGARFVLGALEAVEEP